MGDTEQILSAVHDLREANDEAHEKITGEIVAQGKAITCLQTKWNFLRWLVPASCGAAVGVVTLAAYFLR